MSTVARTQTTEGSHWYTKDGEPMYTVIAKGSGQPRPTTLSDAKKLGLLPSVTTILKILHKQALVDWLCEQTALAVLTTPRNEGEPLDAFVQRVLHTERVQDEEAQKARDLGTDIHDALEKAFQGQEIREDLKPWILPAFEATKACGELVCTEKPLACSTFAGKIDLVQRNNQYGVWIITDFKTAKKIPEKSSWPEHKLQLSAYALLWECQKIHGLNPIKVQNVYISTTDCGKFAIWEHEDWKTTLNIGFLPMVKHWQWSTGYYL